MKNIRESIMVALALLGVLAPLTIIATLLMKQTEPSALVAGFIGVVVGSYTTVFSYYFGSSSGSKSKQDTIDKMTTETPTPPTP